MNKNNCFTALNVLAIALVCTSANAQAQWNTIGGNNVVSTATYLGTDGISTSPLQLITTETGSSALPINFRTNGALRMTILGNNGATNGFVGIGLPNPTSNLEVLNDIDINTSNRAYRIGGDDILKHGGNTSNLFVGIGAGLSNTSGVGNTFIGSGSGASNTTANWNTFVGSSAGSGTTTGLNNAFIGHQAGFLNSTGNNNVFFGSFAGNNNTTGEGNVIMGFNSGTSNTTGSNNILIGRSTNTNAANLTNATAIGANARVDASNSMVLGSVNGINGATSNTRVGIGITAPSTATKLHVENNSDRWIGTFSSTTTGTGTSAIGIVGASRGASRANIGVIGEAAHPVSFFSALNILGLFGPSHNVGVVGRAQGAVINIAGLFEAGECPSNAINYGLYASARKSCNNYAVAAGYFNGPIIATEGFSPSDIQFKDSLVELRDALYYIKRLLPSRFVYKNSSFPSLELPYGNQIGLIAQNIDTVLPNLVSGFVQPPLYDTAGTLIADSIHFKAVNYTGLIPIAIAGIQEQQAQLDSLFGYYVKSESQATDSNYLTKWSPTNRSLTNSLVYDDGQHVGIPTTDPEAKFYVEHVSNGQSVCGIKGFGKGASEVSVGVGGWGSASTSSDSSFAVGVLATADSSAFANAGVFGMVEYATEQEAINGGVVGVATNSHYHNQGGHFETPDSIGDNYGVFAYATNGDFAGYFDGDVHVTGTITSSSDAALKQNIQTLPATDAVAKLQQLQPKTYSFDTQDYPYLNLPTGTQYGLLAQEVEQVLPQLVSNIIQPERRDIKGNSLSPRMEYKGINYMGLVPLLVSAVKDQQTKIDSLQNVIDNRLLALEQRLNNCCERGAVPSDASFKTEGNATVVELNNLQAVVLEQNTPNPFAEQTTINYYIPEGSGTAQVVFFDMLGRTIKSIDAKSGYGSLTVFASNLSQGQYSYALFINGQQIASKSMLKAK